MGKHFRIFRHGLFAITMVFVLSCSGKTKSKSTSSSSGGTGTPPTATAAKPFALKLHTKYDNTEFVNQLTFQETGTDECSVSAASPATTCTVNVPEGRLYYSSLNFEFSWMFEECRLLHFAPYYYKASEDGAYFPPNATSSVNCMASPIPVACFGGAAVDIVDDFPVSRGNIYFPDETVAGVPLSMEATVNSAFSHKYGSNRWTVNDMAAGKVATNGDAVADLGGIGDGYVANTYVNYSFYCRNDWYDPVTYRVDLVVKDVDTNAAGPNDRLTWKEWP